MNLEQCAEKLRSQFKWLQEGLRQGILPCCLVTQNSAWKKIPASDDKPPVTQPTPPAQS